MLAHVLSLLLLAFAVSLDGLGVGITYGLRRIRIPVFSVVIISACSGFVVWLAMQIGTVLASYLSPDFAGWIGAILLLVIGCWALIQHFRRGQQDSDEVTEEEEKAPSATEKLPAERITAKTIVILELKRLGLVIQILRTPQIADVDRSGIISASEAILLGFALSLDSFGAGLGAAMIGFSPVLTALIICTSSGLFLLGGMQLGFRFASMKGMQALSVLPGIMLIVMGIMKLL
ncbi:putative sporulation protein YtaF [Paenibacillus phyllosphaerae]|uniref:Putative sporulation protein YtaF n=1 Tax=Paenibacillus phyllosphaerae TaxID=274593 RepID=A0A7W5AVY2_9BACL|nr:sporulation membrane protein YtaF [Paenibacillus phyllosphaerae]MBB3109577.1 putative sporulation protein YtaF [Paenibacillus phyllosphaerae]